MTDYKTSRKVLRQGFCGAFIFAFATLSYSAKPADDLGAGLIYKIVEGQVYGYEQKDPNKLYLIPNVSPEEIKAIKEGRSPSEVGINYESVEKRTQTRGQEQELRSSYPYPYPYTGAVRRPAESNDALPALTFRNPDRVQLPYGRYSNPIGGLPKYPGRN